MVLDQVHPLRSRTNVLVSNTLMATLQPPGTAETSLWPGRPDLPPGSHSQAQRAELDRVPAAEPRAGRGGGLAQEALGIEVGPEMLEVGAVGPQRGDPAL